MPAETLVDVHSQLLVPAQGKGHVELIEEGLCWKVCNEGLTTAATATPPVELVSWARDCYCAMFNCMAIVIQHTQTAQAGEKFATTYLFSGVCIDAFRHVFRPVSKPHSFFLLAEKNCP